MATGDIFDQLKNDSLLLDKLIDDIKENPVEPTPTQPPIDLNEENMGQFIMQQAGQLVHLNDTLLRRLNKVYTSNCDAEEVGAYSAVVASQNNSLEVLNKIFTQNMKIKAAKELKRQEIEGKKEIAKIREGQAQPQGLIVATREEVFKMLLAGVKRDSIVVHQDDELSNQEEKIMEISDSHDLDPA